MRFIDQTLGAVVAIPPCRVSKTSSARDGIELRALGIGAHAANCATPSARQKLLAFIAHSARASEGLFVRRRRGLRGNRNRALGRGKGWRSGELASDE